MGDSPFATEQDSAAARRTASFAAAFESWRREPLARHAAAVLALALVLAVRWQSVVLHEAVNDERLYLAAFRLSAAGESPYRLSYYYTPIFALAGGWIQERIGATATLASLRLANLLGVALAAWCSLAWLPWPWWRRFATAAAFLCLAPAVGMGVAWGNLSLAVTGTLVAALFIWRSWPIAAGVLLALGLVVKPIGPLAVFILIVHRPRDGSRRQLLAGAVALVVTAAHLVPFPYLDDMLALSTDRRESLRSLSLEHVLFCFGFETTTPALAAVLALAGLFVVRRRTLAPAHFFAIAATVTLLATPIVWNHTMLVALPLEVLALAVAGHRRRSLRAAAAPASEARRYEMLMIVLLVLATQLSGGMGGILKWPLWAQGIVKALPCLAPAILTGYLIRNTRPF